LCATAEPHGTASCGSAVAHKVRSYNRAAQVLRSRLGHLRRGELPVREVPEGLDVLGVHGRVADAAGIQFRLLNSSKGPAVHGPRTQADRKLYRQAMQAATGPRTGEGLEGLLGGDGFEPASGNLAADGGAADESVYAYGFRSPFRGTRDNRGRFWVGDVGLHTKEEVNVVTRAGQNFGWDRAEGHCEGSDCDDVEDPIIEWGRTSSEPFDADDPEVVPSTKRSAWVGPVYEAPAEDPYYGLLDNRLVYGDHFTGWVRALDTSAIDGDVDDRHVGHLAEVVSGRVGPDGYLYLLTLDGTLHRAVLKR